MLLTVPAFAQKGGHTDKLDRLRAYATADGSPRSVGALQFYRKLAARSALRKPIQPWQPPRALGRASGTEVETNDSGAWADRLDVSGPGAAILSGTIDSGDEDAFYVEVPAPGLLDLAVVAGDAPALADPVLLVIDEHGGPVAFNDDSVGAYPELSILVAAGRYTVIVYGFGTSTGNYRASAEHTAKPIPTVAVNTTINGQLSTPTEELAYRFSLASPSELDIACTSSGDLVLTLASRTSSALFDNDDAAGRGLNPSIETALPAGDYLVYVRSIDGVAHSFSLRVGATAKAVPELSCGNPMVGTITAVQNWPVFRVTLNNPTQVDVAFSPGGSSPVSDPFATFYDRSMRRILLQDDNGASLFPRFQTYLPAGEYFLAVQAFGASGTFTVGATCTAASPGAASFGRSSQAVTSGFASKALTLETRTRGPIECTAMPGTMSDTLLSLLDDRGNVVVAVDDSSTVTAHVGHHDVREGKYVCLVRSYGNEPGTFELQLEAPLHVLDVVNDRRIALMGKSGTEVWIGASLDPWPTPFVCPPVVGNLQIVPDIYLGWVTIPASGLGFSRTVPAGIRVHIQGMWILGNHAQFTHMIKP